MKKDPLEWAEFLHKFYSAGYTQQQIAKALGENRCEIGRYLKMARWPDEMKNYIKRHQSVLSNTDLIHAARDFKKSDEIKAYNFLQEKVGSGQVPVPVEIEQDSEARHGHRFNINKFFLKLSKILKFPVANRIELAGSLLFSGMITFYLCTEQFKFYVEQSESLPLLLTILGEGLIWFFSFLSTNPLHAASSKKMVIGIAGFLFVVTSASPVLKNVSRVIEYETKQNSTEGINSVIVDIQKSIAVKRAEIKESMSEIERLYSKSRLEQDKLPENYVTQRRKVDEKYQETIREVRNLAREKEASVASDEDYLRELQKSKLMGGSKKIVDDDTNWLFKFPLILNLILSLSLRIGLTVINYYLVRNFSFLTRRGELSFG